jgi:group I intron endonuclease
LLYFGIVSFLSDTEIGIHSDLFHFTAALARCSLAVFHARRIVQPIFPYNRFEPQKGLFSKGYVKAYKNAVMGIDASQFSILVFLLAVFTDILLGSSDSFLFCLAAPIKIYENAYVQKAQILSENKGKSGIYRWTNNTNGKSYIGSAVNLAIRIFQYYNLDFISKYNMTVYKAIIKYGYSCFTLEILEYCEPNDCIKREQYYLDIFQPEYNILRIAGSSLGHNHSEETRAKISASLLGKTHSDETKGKISAAILGQIRTEEVRAKMCDAKMGENNPMFGVPRPEGAGSPSQPIEVVDMEKNETTIYNSMSEAARALNINKSRISTYFSNNQKKPYKGSYIFHRPYLSN